MVAFKEIIDGMEDLPELKKHKGNKKSTITKSKTSLDTLEADYDKQVSSKYKNLQTATDQYEIIAKRIAQVEGSEFYPEFETPENHSVNKLYANKIAAFKSCTMHIDIVERLESNHGQENVSEEK